MTLRHNSRSCRTASIRSGIAGCLAGELATEVGPLATMGWLRLSRRHALARAGQLTKSSGFLTKHFPDMDAADSRDALCGGDRDGSNSR
jgi:hypothetical protein